MPYGFTFDWYNTTESSLMIRDQCRDGVVCLLQFSSHALMAAREAQAGCAATVRHATLFAVSSFKSSYRV